MNRLLKIHVEVYLAAHMLQREQAAFGSKELIERVGHEFGDKRTGVPSYVYYHCVANRPTTTTTQGNYLWQLDDGRYRVFNPVQDKPHPSRAAGRTHPALADVPEEYLWLLPPEVVPSTDFEPVDAFSWQINRAERSLQVRLLGPLLAEPWGRIWFLDKLGCTCPGEEAYAAEAFHLCFPLRDLFSADYYKCRGKPHLENQFIAYYNRLFGLPEGFGIDQVWRTAPGDPVRHPGAGGRAGWYDEFLDERIPDRGLRERVRDVRRMLGTEADLCLLTERHVVLVECKFLSELAREQYERQQMMGEVLARRLGKTFHFGLVVERERDPGLVEIDVPYVLWSEVWDRMIGRS